MLSNGSHTLPKALPFWYSIDIHLSLASVFAEPQKSRAGWQVAGKYTPVVKHFTPALSSTSMSSVHKNVVPIFLISITNSWSYFCDLCTRIVVKFRCSGLTRVDCWLQARQSEQGLQHKKTGDYLAICINCFWSGKPRVVYAYYLNAIDCVVPQCHPEFSRYISTVATSPYTICFHLH